MSQRAMEGAPANGKAHAIIINKVLMITYPTILRSQNTHTHTDHHSPLTLLHSSLKVKNMKCTISPPCVEIHLGYPAESWPQYVKTLPHVSLVYNMDPT
jgi:hypothetical protein